MITLKNRQNLLFYSDDGILAEIWQAVGRQDEIRTLDIDSFSISVNQGSVFLTGHVSKEYFRDLIEEIACSTPGIIAVCNRLVADPELTIQVVERLAKDERTRDFLLPVGSAHGWVRVGGVVPSRDVQIAAEEIAAQVPSVRGILSRPRVIVESPEIERRPVQPFIQARIYESSRRPYNRHEGIVTQVVIQPRNRLVTHAVISTSDFHNGKFVFYEYLLPVEAMEVVNKESIFLKRNGTLLNDYPAFEPTAYPLAPSDWQPPYPYEDGNVRWSCE